MPKEKEKMRKIYTPKGGQIEGKQLEVEGRATIAIKTEQGNAKLLYDV